MTFCPCYVVDLIEMLNFLSNWLTDLQASVGIETPMRDAPSRHTDTAVKFNVALFGDDCFNSAFDDVRHVFDK